jgi:DNA-binding CsgD family transcriptional regulator
MKEVATVLSISTRTAESYKYEIMHTLGVHTNAELIHHAIRIGLITVPRLESAA